MLPDVQLLKPEYPIGISRVGVVGVKKLVEVERKFGRPIILISNFSVFVDLPSNLKGVSLSRNFEVVDEVLESLTAKPIKQVEELVIKIAESLLQRHEYATKAEVFMESELIIKKKTPKSNIHTQEVVKIICEAFLDKNNNRKVFVGVEVAGLTACPCAQELLKVRAKERLKEKGYDDETVEEILKLVPIASHNQRGKATVKVEVKNFKVPISKLIEIVKASMSSETYEILKREDELEVVEIAHRNTRFVEDSVRIIAAKIVEYFKDVPDDVLIFIRQENEESIHQHNIVAERIATLGELRSELSKI
ncbi:MAG: GTP cyclohydrolase MptA [Archaeoglobaceae archaeon]|nr:GTP cyclohydrolase MptA [Archaeoglobaceae archaeon]MCX8151635.1 GTP cyclohydrolase MptA [Archaeoglobaceae archaeon]MDW8013087.1 GTP cyclohydrolase MptA [Archaeoglobaceae archaeon]